MAIFNENARQKLEEILNDMQDEANGDGAVELKM